ncbi:MAG: alpha/beta fold hydrolase [Mariniphaga sp.]
MIKRYLSISLVVFFRYMTFLNAQEINHVNDLPVHISVSKGTQEGLVMYITGDGGWNNFNQQLVQVFEERGYAVVALNSRKYFWSEKSPDEFAHDVEMLSGYYMKELEKTSIIIVGYSFGADVASFLPGRLSVELQKKIRKITLISPSASTDFVIRLADLVGEGENMDRKYKVKPEIEQIHLPVVCTFGLEETKILKSALSDNDALTIKVLPGDHRYNNDFALLSKMIGL